MFWKKKTNTLNFKDKELLRNLKKRRLPTFKQLLYINKFLNTWEKALLYLAFILFFVGIFWLGYLFYDQHSVLVASEGGNFTEAFVKNPVYINPILASKNTVDADLSRLVYSSLLKYDKDLNLVPDLTDKYTISDDGKVYTFHIRSDVKFHDGEPLTIDDVLFTYELIQSPEYKSPYYSDFVGVQIEKIDENTIKFTLPNAYTPFIHFFTIGILPMHIWGNVNANNFTLAQYNIKPIGSGPYKFDKLVKDVNGNIVEYDLTKNHDYYGTNYYIKNIVCKFFNDYQPAIDALLKGEVDALGNLPYKELDYVAGTDDINIYKLSLPQYTALFFNTKNNKYLQEKYLRQALTLSLDKSKILRQLFGDGINIIDGPIYPKFINEDFVQSVNDFDLNKAKELLKENSWKLNDKGILVKAKDGKDDEVEELKLKLYTPNKEDSLAIATFVKDTWAQLGIQVEIHALDGNEIKTVIKDRDYDVLLYGESLGNDPDLFPFWHSTQVEYPGLNLSQFENKKVDTLIEEARQTLNEEERVQKYKELNKLIKEEYPAIFLYSPKYIYLLNKRVKDYQVQYIYTYADRWNNFNDLYIKTKKKFTW